MTFCSYVLSHYNCDFYEESVHSDLVDKIEEFKRIIRSVQPRNPFEVNTKPLQLVQYMYLMQKPEDATTGHVMKLLRAIRSVTLFITNRNGQFCGDILTNPKVCICLYTLLPLLSPVLYVLFTRRVGKNTVPSMEQLVNMNLFHKCSSNL